MKLLNNAPFFWKFSRDGDFSKTYVSFILDVHDSNIEKIGKDLFWKVSFNSLFMTLLLLQDIEIFKYYLTKCIGITMNQSFNKGFFLTKQKSDFIVHEQSVIFLQIL